MGLTRKMTVLITYPTSMGIDLVLRVRFELGIVFPTRLGIFRLLQKSYETSVLFPTRMGIDLVGLWKMRL